MSAAIGLDQALGVHGGVDLRGRERGMAEQFLDRAQIAAASQQMRGKGVPQGMRVAFAPSPSAPRSRAIANCTRRGESGPPLAPTKSGPSAGNSWGQSAM